ncbi:MAG: hypothetical protein K5989_10520 [Lachnospiraceae bacterium]|nr:hypothetical protein [Lachnospiraceae bacterium]
MPEEEIKAADLYHYTHYLYGEPFLGSHRGMRFRIAREPLANVFFKKPEEQQKDASFSVTVWPEPFSYEKTSEEKMSQFSFPFTEEGLQQVVECLNSQYREKKELWEEARTAPFV